MDPHSLNESDTEISFVEDDHLFFSRDNADDKHNTYASVEKSIHREYKISTAYVQDINTSVINSWFQSRNLGLFAEVCVVIIALALAALSSLPYVAYTGLILPSTWLFFCVARTMTYSLVFSVYWIEFGRNTVLFFWSDIKVIEYNMLYVVRQVGNCVFAIMYSVLYSIKWLELKQINIWQISIPAFLLSWLLVYYTVIDKHLSTSVYFATSSTSNIYSRRRRAALNSIKRTETLCYNSITCTNKVYSMLAETKSASVLFSRLTAVDFYNTEAEKIDMYEDSVFDSWLQTRTSAVNVFLGVSLIPLVLAMAEDYGHPLFVLIGKEEPFLWILTISCFCLAVFYVAATYSIHHKTIRSILSVFNHNKTISVLFKCIRRLPLSFFAGCVAAVRLNASFTIFGRIVARFEIPYSLGMPLIWIGICVVFFIDYGACMKIVSYAVKRLVSMICVKITLNTSDQYCLINYLTAFIQRYSIRYHTKNLKWVIRNCDENFLDTIMKYLL